jgi:hypothetical protein
VQCSARSFTLKESLEQRVGPVSSSSSRPPLPPAPPARRPEHPLGEKAGSTFPALYWAFDQSPRPCSSVMTSCPYAYLLIPAPVRPSWSRPSLPRGWHRPSNQPRHRPETRSGETAAAGGHQSAGAALSGRSAGRWAPRAGQGGRWDGSGPQSAGCAGVYCRVRRAGAVRWPVVAAHVGGVCPASAGREGAPGTVDHKEGRAVRARVELFPVGSFSPDPACRQTDHWKHC